ncbi:glycosyltransferase family 2 protein [Vibrio cholerae]|uniref:glycosyltransferase family 2 protein n=2 Tax=Vibrio cholerae TaxID=666 RepID=UPI001CA33F20|nr:glycosyltransferase family 2 protein [Vibrio cholerae]
MARFNMKKYLENVSIIMPCYNAFLTVEESVYSIINQTYPHWRLYIIDDCSNEETRSKLLELSTVDSRINVVFLESNTGVANARNVGINLAQGEYISFLDSDDLWLRDKLDKQIKFLMAGYNVVCSNYTLFTDNSLKPISTRKFPKTFEYHHMLYGNKIGNLTGIYNQKILGKFYQKKIGHEDYLMWLDIMREAKLGYCIQQSLASYRVTKTSLSSNKIKASSWQWRIYRDNLNLTITQSLYYWLAYVFNAVSRNG